MNYSTSVRWLAIGWTIVILIGCLTPHDQIPEVLTDISDKLEHMAIFALFTLLWAEAGMRVNLTLLIGILFGALIEVLQYVLPINRSADWGDLLADTIGAIVGVVFYWGIHKLIRA